MSVRSRGGDMGYRTRTVFVLNEDGSESLLNFSLDEGDVILHRVARRFVVRRGSLAGCVVNRGIRVQASA